MNRVKIIYGTTGGNTQLVCEYITQIWKEAGLEVALERAEKTNVDDIFSHDILVLACPTYGRGRLEEHHFQPFFDRIQDHDFTEKKCAIIALGDVKYETDYALESAKILEDFLKAKSAEIICPTLRIMKTPVPLLETQVKKWAENFISLIKA